jgi:Domain of unknown function (DUF4386)
MTIHSLQPPVPSLATEARRPVGHVLDEDWSIRTASLIAGVGLLVMSALAGVGYRVAIAGLVTQGDAARTAQDIMGSESLFRFGILSLFLVVGLDVVVAWALRHVFSPVDKGISTLAAWLRIAYAAVFAIAISRLVGVLGLLNNHSDRAGSSTTHLQTLAFQRINTFTDIWDAGLVLFGLHLLVIAYLAYRSGYVPKLLAVLVAIAGLGYLFDSFGALLSRGASPDVSSVTFIGEFLLALWLVIWGRRITVNASGSYGRTNGAAR